MQIQLLQGLSSIINWPHFQPVMFTIGYLLLLAAFILNRNRHHQQLHLLVQHNDDLKEQLTDSRKRCDQLLQHISTQATPPQTSHYSTTVQQRHCDSIAEQQPLTTRAADGPTDPWVKWHDLLCITAGDEALACDLLNQLLNVLPKVIRELDQIATLTHHHRQLIHQWLGLFRMTGLKRMSSRLEEMKNILNDETDQITSRDKACLVSDLRELLLESFMLFKQKSQAVYLETSVA